MENILLNQEENDRKYYAAMKCFEYTPLFYFYLPLLSDDIFNVISKQKPPTYDFFTLRNNKNQSIFHVLFAFSIYILLYWIEKFNILKWLIKDYPKSELKRILLCTDGQKYMPIDLLFVETDRDTKQRICYKFLSEEIKIQVNYTNILFLSLFSSEDIKEYMDIKVYIINNNTMYRNMKN